MIHKILEEKVDIDQILVVTFTNAAAAEMRERILDAIYQKMEEEPENRELQKQITLLNKASICTIHSFCLEVIRNHFYEIDASANFRIADTAEIDLLRYETIEEIFEENYEKEDSNFLSFVEMYTSYRDDLPLKEQILKVDTFIQSMPFPEEWLSKKVEQLKMEGKNDFSQTDWGALLLQNAKEEVEEGIHNLENLTRKMNQFSELTKFQTCIQEDLQMYQSLLTHMVTWEEAHLTANQMQWGKWPTDRKVTMELKEEAKEIRDQVKKQIKKMMEQTILLSNEDVMEDIQAMYQPMKNLQNLVLEFEKRFADKKKEKNILDFHDIEHFALKILIQKEDGKIVPTEVAKKYQAKFQEVAIDEYQDSNLVQEYILKSVSRSNNRFMVGDVKQSIYKFRQARPELFLEKYHTYGLEEANENGKKIQLFKNFRSRENILQITNFVFQQIMSEKLGDINYDESEYLNLGADYRNHEQVEAQNFEKKEIPETFLLEGKTQVYLLEQTEEKWSQWDEQEEAEEKTEKLEDIVLEAKFVASKIQEILKSDQYVFDKKKKIYRKVTYRDIAIILRSTSNRAPIFEKEFQDKEIPVFTDTGTQFLDSIEIQTFLSLLKIIDNPMQDIPLVTVLRSSMGGFSDNELVQIRVADKNCHFYEAMQKAQIQVPPKLRKKIEQFLAKIQEWKKEENYLPLDAFLWKLYDDTGYYYFVGLMPNGERRQANLKILFEKAKQYEKSSLKGLFQFIRFIEKLHQNSGDFGSAKVIGENENVVRIMSIHKSKGLEFPIVCLCGMGKKFNLQDTTEPILLHHEYGLGVTYKNPELKIEYQTLAKEAIKKRMEQETISEEMRILYVALTRAKEHLILTGVSKDVQKQIEEKEKRLEINPIENETEKLNPSLPKKYRSYLDWVELVYLANQEQAKSILDFHILTKKEWAPYVQDTQEEKQERNVIEQLKEQVEERKKNETDFQEKQQKEIQQLNWKYPYQILAEIPTKTSVTKLKELENEERENQTQLLSIFPQPLGEEESVQLEKPRFRKEEEKLSPAEIGTIMHLCIQKLDEKRNYTKEELKQFIEELTEKGILTQKQKEGVSLELLETYTKSALFQDLKEAKEIEKEKPFYIQIPLQEIYPEHKEILEKSGGSIFVQGVIDLYYVDKNDKLILVDYKTDFVKEGKEQEIIKRYEKQLQIYQRALEKALNRKVDRVAICLIRKNATCMELQNEKG